MTNVFEVQADIATKVADALGVALADSVRAGLEARPTANLEAYDAFLKGEAAIGQHECSSTCAERQPGAAVLPARRGARLELSAGLGAIVPGRTRACTRT